MEGLGGGDDLNPFTGICNKDGIGIIFLFSILTDFSCYTGAGALDVGQHIQVE